jgi:hypothetical protein
VTYIFLILEVKGMKKILVFMLLILLLIGSAWAQPTPPATPPSPESQGIQIPQASSSSQAPPSSESDQALIATSEASARATAPSYGATAGSGTYASTYMVVPPGIQTINRFYVPYVPSTVAGCNFGQWLPIWMDVQGWGLLYMYEWYPDGRLVTSYPAYVQYPGWQKMWFNGDAPGWHILQYYCNGWSNYIYVYVYGQPYYPPYPSGQWTDLGPYTGPTSDTPSYSGTSFVTMRSNWLRGYDVYVDGMYIGTEGTGSDILDGVYNFRVPGGMSHTIVLMKNGQSYPETGTFLSGVSYRFTI